MKLLIISIYCIVFAYAIIMKCPNGCKFENGCEEIISGTNFCNPEFTYNLCPDGCKANPSIFGQCITDEVIDPIFINLHHVLSPLSNVLCPNWCFPNSTTNKCESMDRGKYICDSSSKPHCPLNCVYNTTHNKCILSQLTPNDFCDAHYMIRCTWPYKLNVSMDDCTVYNDDSICKGIFGYSSDWYKIPLNLYSDFMKKNPKCIYPMKMHCELRTGVITKCPKDCKYDSLSNICIPPNNETLCGTPGMECPIGFTWSEGYISWFSGTRSYWCSPNNYFAQPVCREGFKLMHYESHNIIRSACFPVWYNQF